MRDRRWMRATLNLDDDVLRAAQELAALSGRSVGQVLSDLARAALRADRADIKIRDGVPILAPAAGARLGTSEEPARLEGGDGAVPRSPKAAPSGGLR